MCGAGALPGPMSRSVTRRSPSRLGTFEPALPARIRAGPWREPRSACDRGRHGTNIRPRGSPHRRGSEPALFPGYRIRVRRTPAGPRPRSRRGSPTERVAPTSLGIRCNRHPSLRVSLRGHPDCAKTTDEEPADNNNCGPDNIRHCVLRTSCSTRSTTLAHDRLCMRMRPRRWARHRWLGG